MKQQIKQILAKLGFFFVPKDLSKQFLNYKSIANEYNFKSFKNIIDIGANSGNWSILFKTYHKRTNFFLIEAEKKHLKKIRKISNYYHIGPLYKKKSKKVFYSYKAYNGTGSSFYKENTKFPYHKIILKTDILDNILTKKFNKKIYDLIKIDTQGSELDILKGAINTLNKTRYIILETQKKEYNIGAPNNKIIEKFLFKNGFKKLRVLYHHKVNNKIIQSDILYGKIS